jgi:RNA polymerase sigma-70 factor, ECF subfamily
MDDHDQDTDDRILVQRFLDGEEAAFDRLVERYYHRIDRLAQYIVRSPSAAEDITQETFLRAYCAMPHFRGEASVFSWLYRITVNLCLNHLRHQSHRPSIAENLTDSSVSSIIDPSALIERRERDRAIRNAIDALPPHYRIALILRDLEGLSYQEIAALLVIPVGTVKSRIIYGKRLLHEKLRSLLDEPSEW